jgi:hypothetical protein
VRSSVAHAVALTLAVLTTTPLAAAEVRCPPRLPGMHQGFEQVGPVPAAHWLLRTMRLFDGPPGEERKQAPADLAPDQTVERPGGYTSTWQFGGTGDLLMVCTYNGSGTYYRALLHPLPTRCTFQDDNHLRQGWCEIP